MDEYCQRDCEREILSNHVTYKPCQTRMVSGNRQFVFAFGNEIFKEIEIKFRYNYE